MREISISPIKTLVWIALIAFDLFIYTIIGTLLMRYDDSCNASKGEYFSWQSMETFDRLVFAALNIWHLVNIGAVIFLGFKIYQVFKMRTADDSSATGETASAE